MEYGKYADAVLRQVPAEVFEQYKDRLPENFRKRAEHFYGESARVEAGVKAWREGDIETFGQLVSQSGYSSIHLHFHRYKRNIFPPAWGTQISILLSPDEGLLPHNPDRSAPYSSL